HHFDGAPAGSQACPEFALPVSRLNLMPGIAAPAGAGGVMLYRAFREGSVHFDLHEQRPVPP
ncbi:hypothetical protein, partial [Streptomyces diastatochromogenes]|uniref:hypothetical protein n=1 Tax=Streptomyces diastatochromogenes TaxID=42236 RepID=UPI0036855419